MAITITAGAWAAGSTSCAPSLPASPQAGDVHVMFVGAKPYTAVIGTPANWTPITNTDGTNGTTANGTDTGSVVVKAFYRIWQSGDTATPSSAITSGNTALGCIHRFRPTAGSSISTPVGNKGTDVTSGTDYAATMGADIGITAGDAVVSYTFIPGNNSSFGSPTLSATGVTFGTVTENPATEGNSGTGLDCGASASTALPSAGPSSAAAIVGWTLGVAQTGMSNLIRIREAVTSVNINATSKALTLARYAATIGLALNIAASVDTMTLSTYPATVETGAAEVVVSASVHNLTLNKYAATVKLEKNISASVVNLTLSENAATITLSKDINATSASLSLSVYPATIDKSLNIAASSHALTITGHQATISLDYNVQASVHGLNLAVYNTTITLEETLTSPETILILPSGKVGIRVTNTIYMQV